MRPVSPRVVELLNEALATEITVMNAYFLHARMLEAQGFPTLGKVFYDLSIGEMRDADGLIRRILLFEGRPTLAGVGPVRIGETPQEMLALGLDGEQSAVAQYNGAADECRHLGDHGTASVFDEMVRDEERHADWFESQTAAIAVIGAGAYLAQLTDAATGPT